MARVVPCPFCEEGVILPGIARTQEVISELVSRHLAGHVDQALEEIVPNCARCQRYAGRRMDHTDPLHRPCYAPDCSCSCSYPPPHVAQEG